MEIISEFLTVIITIITGIVTVYKMNSSQIQRRLKEYHKKILIPFIAEYKKDLEGRDWCKFVGAMVNYEDDFIPPYVHYLLKKRKKDDLIIVLINDVYEYYDNERNNFNLYFTITFNMICKIFYVSGIITAAASMMVAVLDTLVFIFLDGKSDWKEIIEYIVVCIVAIGLSKFIFHFFIDDIYSCKLSQIRRIISKKTKYISKNIKKYDDELNLENNE